MLSGLMVLLATGFGIGHVPWIPGTFGALLGIPLALWLARAAWWRQLLIVALIALLAVPVCDVAERHFGIKDDGRIVADETAAFPLAVLGLPVARHPGLLAFAFASSRVFDWVKPPPVNRAEALHGGTGIVLDDVLASLYALFVNVFAWRVFLRLRKHRTR